MFEKVINEEERGQVGIGTLIVFIAMVLVAAIAAGVLINTAGFLQTQAEATGEESTDLVSERIDVNSEVGIVSDASAGELGEIRLGVAGAAGADQIDLSETTIQAVGPGGQQNLVFTPVAYAYNVPDASGPDAITIQNTISVDEQTVEVDVGSLSNGDQIQVTNQDGSGSVTVDAEDSQINTIDISSFSISSGDSIQAELLDSSGNSLSGPVTATQTASVETNSISELGPNEFAVESGGSFVANPVLNDDEQYTVVINPGQGAFDDGTAFEQGQTATLDIVSPSSATTSIELAAPDLFTADDEAVRL
ncbi:archaellin/type IV pilin N-terminal domain-containing protein [Halorubrum sp. ARQ200]|uniref:archaellin/type IV pilin N-terminal domain-containing protein n=1 Tax=Halorubrum sp. ARQ200 TaxID=1855872 RepID=UPI001F545A4B|nr:archaellin/type IV pilin N-terminal domain-containing protein [Halorubrum sp. ARQ200]